MSSNRSSEMSASDHHQGRQAHICTLASSSSTSNSNLPQVVGTRHKRPRLAQRRSRQDSKSSASALHRPSQLFNQLQQQTAHHQYRSAMAINLSGSTPATAASVEQCSPNQHHLVSRGGSSLTVADFRSAEYPSAAPPMNLVVSPNYHHQHQYSSSQAQLQSLTEPPVSGALISSDTTLRKQQRQQQQQQRTATPISKGNQHQHNNNNHHSHLNLHLSQQQQQQQQHRVNKLYSRAAHLANNSTKPMTSSSSSMMLNEPSNGSGRQSSRVAQRSVSIPAVLQHPVVGSAGTQAALVAPTSAWRTPAPLVNGSQLLPPPYSAEPPAQLQSPMSETHVICQQPTTGSGQQQQQTATTGGRNGTQTASGQTNQSGGGVTAMGFPVQMQQPASSQQQVLNFLTNAQQQQQLSGGFPTTGAFGQQQHYHSQQQQQHQQTFLNLHQQQQQQLLQEANNGQINSNHHHQFSSNHLNANSKHKSCLTCADISIKWYIVVIALLGLICALIGTIVGAVHSAGRDYISLALLLIGVGLVLVAISWIALRITIKTYKSNRQQSARTHHQQATPQLATPIGRLLPTAGQSSGSSSLQRSLLNERIYMMAAAAAAAAAISRAAAARNEQQQQHAESGQSPEASAQTTTAAPTAATTPGILSSLKGRLPRRLARLLPYSSLRDSGGLDGQPLTATAGRTNEPASPLSPPPPPPQQTLPLPPQAQALAAATQALLHQYQAALLPPGHPAAFLFPPPPLQSHLLGVTSPEFPLRPPPPSYNASMQDQRLRALLQERANLHLFPTPPPPPPPPPPPSQLSAGEESSVGSTGEVVRETLNSREQPQPSVVSNDLYGTTAASQSGYLTGGSGSNIAPLDSQRQASSRPPTPGPLSTPSAVNGHRSSPRNEQSTTTTNGVDRSRRKSEIKILGHL